MKQPGATATALAADVGNTRNIATNEGTMMMVEVGQEDTTRSLVIIGKSKAITKIHADRCSNHHRLL